MLRVTALGVLAVTFARTTTAFGGAASSQAGPTKIDVVVCAERCAEAGHCCEGDVSACNNPSCVQGCLIGAAPPTTSVAGCNKTCAAVRAASCTYSNPALRLNLTTCGQCPEKPINCGCPIKYECELGCSLTFGGALPPPPTPPPTAPTPSLPRCHTDYNCSFNGVCGADGVCICDKQWTGRYCHQLNLVPVVNGSGLNRLHGPAKTSTWGGTVLYDNATGMYHMWASEILNHCGIHRWVSNSVVVHAVSHSATGSFTRQEVVWPLFTHEPTAARAPDGSYVLFVTHHDGPPIAPSQHTCNCTDGTSASGGCNQEIGNCNNGTGCAMYTFMSYASNPAGPWSPLQSLAHMQANPYTDMNFAPVIEEDGSLIAWNRWDIYRATNWKDPMSYKNTGAALRPEITYGIGEDPFLYKDAKGRYHVITHNGPRGEPGPEGDCGRHFFSETGDAGTWDAAPLHPSELGGCAYWRANVPFADGERRTFYRRERPHLIFQPDGTTIAALTTSAIDSPISPYLPGGTDGSYTMLQAVNQ